MHIIRSNLAAFATAAASAFAAIAMTLGFAPAASAAPRCVKPALLADRLACAKAQEGPDALRRFVSRTQTIYGLYFWDYITREQIERQQAASEPDTRVAQAE